MGTLAPHDHTSARDWARPLGCGVLAAVGPARADVGSRSPPDSSSVGSVAMSTANDVFDAFELAQQMRSQWGPPAQNWDVTVRAAATALRSGRGGVWVCVVRVTVSDSCRHDAQSGAVPWGWRM